MSGQRKRKNVKRKRNKERKRERSETREKPLKVYKKKFITEDRE